MPDFAPEICHARGLDAAARMLRFDTQAYPPEWVSASRRTFKQLLGAMPGPCEPNIRIVRSAKRSGGSNGSHQEIEFLFASEPGADVPCWLLIPEGNPLVPLIICLQGHTSGAHLSLGRPLYPGDGQSLQGDRDYAVQAVSHGFAALVIEQRALGKRADQRRTEAHHHNGCHHAAMNALLLGRTLAGERVLDVTRAIDAVARIPEAAAIDLARIGIMGNSGGGLISFYTAAYDPRIAAVMASCALCTYRDSIGAVDHCADNYLPGIAQYFDMADIAGLIAPRPLVVVSGREDPLFPHAGVELFMSDAQEIYKWLGGKLEWVVGDGGHRFYAAEAWPVFRRATGW